MRQKQLDKLQYATKLRCLLSDTKQRLDMTVIVND